jgi:two-component system chemotaxis response regulator CheY
MNILIVDDDELARLSLSNILGSVDGVTGIAEAEDGEQAWELLAGGLRPLVCCCDVRMPRLDGLGLLRRARADALLRDLPFLLVSSASDRATVQDAITIGVSGYILKPYLAVQTRATVARLLREQLAARAENTLSTRRRLGLDRAGLRQLLERLRADVAEQAGGPATDDATLARLRRASEALGLWRGAALLQQAQAGQAGAAPVLAELACLVDEQLAGLAPVAA